MVGRSRFLYARCMHHRGSFSLLILALISACSAHVDSNPVRGSEPDSDSTSVSDQAASVALTGRVLGHDGRPLPASILGIRRVGYTDEIAKIELPADGRFAVELPGPGAYIVSAAGVDHAGAYRYVLVAEAPIELELRLGTYARADPGDALALTLRFIDEHGEPVKAPISTSATRAAPDEDHRVRVEVPAGARALQYQLTGLAGGRTFNGPGGQRWVYDGGGDYWAEIDASPSTPLELTLDLDALPPADLPPQLSLRGAEIYPLPTAQEPLTAVWPRFEAEGVEAIPAIAADARTSVEAVEDPLAAKLAAIEWLLFFAQFVRDDELPVDSLLWVFERARLDDPVWLFYTDRLGALHWADKPELDAALAGLLEHHDDPGLRASLAVTALYIARRDGHTEGLDDRYRALVRDYPGTTAIVHAAVDFDPDRPLQIGRPMPDWSFVGLDGQTPIRAADLRGQPYLFELWASWCGPCVEDMAANHAAYAAINPDPERPAIEFVAVSVDGSPDDVATFREQWPMPWRHAWLDADAWKSLEQRWTINAVPTVVLVDADGIIVELDMAVRREQLLPRLERFVAQ
jgi:thiol-disulfide isomerase/thioredoxin